MEKTKQTWQAGKPKKKPDYDKKAITEELLEAAVEAYGENNSLQTITHTLTSQGFKFLNPIKVRKLLITAGEIQDRKIYESATADEVLRLWKAGKSTEEIMSILELSRSSVNSYLPYTKIIYKMKESSVGADREKLYRERKKACEKLRKEPTTENLWNAVVLFAGYPFQTSKGLCFTYKVKGGEIFITRKEKSITRATVDIAFQRALELGECATGPKKLNVFGASYLYPVFVRLEVIKIP